MTDTAGSERVDGSRSGRRQRARRAVALAPRQEGGERSGSFADAVALLERLGATWHAPTLATVTVVFEPALRTTLARYRSQSRRIEINPRLWGALDEPTRRELLIHEAAHAVVSDGSPKARPHGAEWRELMSRAGIASPRHLVRGCRPSRAPARATTATARFEHRCPVCQTVRFASRPVRAWRCAQCAAAGLPGTFVIQRLGASR